MDVNSPLLPGPRGTTETTRADLRKPQPCPSELSLGRPSLVPRQGSLPAVTGLQAGAGRLPWGRASPGWHCGEELVRGWHVQGWAAGRAPSQANTHLSSK